MATQQEGGSGYIVNPRAIMVSLEERYAYLLNHQGGLADFERLLADSQWYFDRITAQIMNDPQSPLRYDASITGDMNTLRQKYQGAVDNAGLVAYASSRDAAAYGDFQRQVDLAKEIMAKGYEQGWTVEQVIDAMIQGGVDVGLAQNVASHANDPSWFRGGSDTLGTSGAGGAGGSIPAPGDGSSSSRGKSFKPVANDITNPQTEFQKGYADFTRQLGTDGSGRQPQLSVLNQRYQEFYNMWLGDLEQKKKSGEEAANVFKEAYVNIGKNTDPQFNTETDQFQLQTVRPKQSVADWLAANIDPEDVYASTEPAQRPGRSTGGFVGFVRRVGR